MIEIVNNINRAIKNKPFDLNDEKRLQLQMAAAFSKIGLDYKREHKFNKQSIIDFFIDPVGVEVKIKGTAMAIYRQCERYLAINECKALVLVTNKSMGFPATLNDKPVFCINLALAWL